jgi:flagellum-specific peptidoglycan hydrolase FlgJ
MINKIIICILLLGLVACNTTRPVVTTTKRPVQYKPISKVEVKKPVTKPVENTSSQKPSEVLDATSKVIVTTDIVLNYISQFKVIAQDNMRSHKIPASITLAQAILESGSGVGDLALKANNHFGIKCHKEWTGDSVRHDDDSSQECFRKYNDPSQSFEDHSNFLTSRPWYNNLFLLDISDYKKWAYGLKKSGYATDPKYPAKLIGLIEKYQLYNYDKEVLDKNFKFEDRVVVNKTENKSTKIISDLKLHTVTKGDTFYSISKRYNITIDELKSKNNMSDNSISIGQNLIIQ